MSQVDQRHEALLVVLAEHDVHFVLVGGVALQLHGFSGATRDVDVTIAVDPENEHRVTAALEALQARPFMTGERGSAFHTRLGGLEIMRTTDGVGDYEAWSLHATTFHLTGGLEVQVGRPSDLLLSKEAAGRVKDTEALPRIRAELLASGALDPSDVRGAVAELATPVAPDPHASDLLGPRPTERRARGLWDHAAQLIADHRTRWGVPEDTSGLGPPPAPGSAHAADRDTLDRQLDRLRARLHRDSSA
jgi:hypothetical protein